MSQFITFTRKEFRESFATVRMYVLIPVFVLIGLMNPIVSLLTPSLMDALAEQMGGPGGEGMIITAWTSWETFFGNASGEMGMGTIAFVIAFCGVVSSEFSKGTMINLLTKGLKRPVVILSKFFTVSVLWTLCLLVAIGVTAIFTAILFDPISFSHTILAFFGPWLFGLFAIALLILGGTIVGSFYGGLAAYGGVAVVLGLLSLVPGISRFSPGGIGQATYSLLAGVAQPGDFIPAFIVTTVLIAGMICASIIIFNKKRV